MKNKKRVYILLSMSVVWAIIIFIFCTMPPGDIPKIRIPCIDKVFHFSVFFVQSVLFSLLFRFRTRNSYFQIILLSTLLTFVYGGLIEVLQSNFFNRAGELYDLIADVAGGFVGAIIYPAVLRLCDMVFQKV